MVQTDLMRTVEYLGVGVTINFYNRVIGNGFLEKSKKIYLLCSKLPALSNLARSSNSHYHPGYQEKLAREWLYTTSMKPLNCKGNYYDE